MDEAGRSDEVTFVPVEDLGSEWFEDRFDGIVGASLENVAAAGSLLYVLFTLLHPVYFDPPELYPLLALGAATVLALATMWWTARQGKIPEGMAQPVMAVGLALVLLNALSVAAVRQSPESTFWFALVAIAGGMLLLSREWLAGLLVADVAGWLWIAYVSPPDPGWTGYGILVLLSSLVLAGLALTSRRRVYRGLLTREHSLRGLNRELDQARREAEAAGELRSRFLANVSHDVRTPASAIVAATRELRTGDLDEDQRETLSTIETSARHLVRLIDDILDISQVEAGQLSVEEEPFELDRVLRASMGMVASQAAEESLELVRRVDDGVPAFLASDPHRLQQVLGNLLSNAVKFTSEGRVELRVSVESEDPPQLRFAVADTGIGIPEDRQDELFQPFSRIQDSETEGTGLGLAICKRLVEALGGEIGVESTPGEGSVFWFTLPVGPADPDEIDPAREPPPLYGKQAWIVGAGGSPASTLDAWGLETEEMPGIGFVEETRQQGRRPDLVVLDLVTLEAPEAFLAERVRAWRADGIPVLVLTADGELPEALADVSGPGAMASTSSSERELRTAVEESLAGTAEAEAGEPPLDPETAERHPLSILIVEDSPVNRRLLVRTMERLGYEPDGLERGDEAIEAIVENGYDLVFLDLQLPGADGEEVLEDVRERLGEQAPRVVVLTGHTDEASIDRVQEAGADAYLAKPASLRELLAEIEATSARESEPASEDDTEDEPVAGEESEAAEDGNGEDENAAGRADEDPDDEES